MSDLLPDDAWVNSFLATSPRPLLSALQRRLHASTTHVNALAELYKQRAAIEAAYAEGLSKLARTAEQGGLSGKTGNDWEKASGEGRLWDSIISELTEPLRELPSKVVAWRRIGEQDASLDKTLKEYEKTSAKLEKASSKAKSSKADVLQNELNQITSSLSSLSPMVYTTYQRLDEERLRVLKEVVVRWGTVKGDMATRDGQRAENIISTLLSWETSDEVLKVGRKLGGTGGARVPESAVTTRGGRTRSESNANSTRSGRDRDGNFEAIGEEATAARIQDSTTLVSAQASNSADIQAPPVDEEGFSVAPSDRHRNPWEDPNELVPTPAHNNNTFTRNFTASPNASQENLPSSGSSQNQTQPRLNLSLAPKPIQETEEERQAALQRVQQTLQMPPSQPSRRSTIARGRRDVRNTMFAGSTDDGSLGLGGLSLHKVAEPEEELVESPSSGIGSPVPVNGHSSASHQVARRTSSASVTSNNPFDSPGLTQGISLPVTVASSDPGLRANLNESINVILRGKEVQRIQITGEIHLSLRPGAGSPATTGPIHIRLNAFERLEKIAPNPAYLAQVPDRPGEYFLNSEVLAAATAKSPASGKGTLLFKYVVHVQPGKETSSAPLILDPAFLCKDGETRMILNYRLNETSPIQSLSNVTFIAAFAPGPAVNNVQAKPAGGVWSPSTRRMQWKLDALPAKEGKIIAKFITEPGEALSPQGVQTSWSVEGTLTSGLGLEVVSGEIEGNQWTFEEVQKNVTAGKYLAEPTISQ
ncbi:hypothetical protein CI109_106976 [Kwoniella shandongensis]|uniref:MHD domain-containing protein n=1 Tax=Kwoniella shandongensis TaxID=1734106 RepID=A0AAJ8LN76_9TREE